MGPTTEIPFAKRNRPVVVSQHAFNSESIPGFSNYLGKDGKLRYDGEALVFDSHRYSVTRNDSFDHYKYAIHSKTPIKFSFKKESIVSCHAAAVQLFSKNTSGRYFPSAYEKRVTNMQMDPRMCNGFVQLIGIHNGVILGFFITNRVVYAVSGMDPSLCKTGFPDVDTGECGNCNVQDYDCNNYRDNAAWQKFKMGLLEEDFSRYLMFRDWQAFCKANNKNVMDWDLFREWRNDNPQSCGNGNSQMFSDWRSNGGSFDEYCIVNAWNKWIVEYKTFYPCNPGPDASCGGVCGSAPMCGHYFSDKNPYNCYSSKASDSTNDSYGIRENCCCVKPANFLDVFPVAERGVCDPLMDWQNLAIGIDRANKTANFYVGLKLKWQVTIGMRSAEKYRVIERGGYCKPIDLDMAVFSVGTGSLMDASMVDNYYRYRVTNDNKSRSALTNVLPVDDYRQVLEDSTGAIVPLLDAEKGPDGFFSVVSTSSEPMDTARLFGQGCIMKIKYVTVMTRIPVRAYELPRNYGKTECCGASTCGRSCLSAECDADCDSIWDLLDPRELQIEFEQPRKRSVGDDCFLPNAFGNGEDGWCGGAGSGGGGCGRDGTVCVRAKIVKLQEGQRYWARQCTSDFVGSNLY